MQSQLSHLNLIINPKDLAPVLGNSQLLVIDLRSPENYQSGHIEGAYLVTPAETQLGEAPGPGRLPSQQQLEQLVKRLGLTADKHVVVYDDEGGGWAGRFIWLLDAIGHTRYSYLDGGILAWRDEEMPLSQQTPLPKTADIPVTISPAPTITRQSLMDQIEQPGTTIWDARSAEEYRGEKVIGQKGGHIPGARNLNWTDMMDPENCLRLKPKDQLLAMLAAREISSDTPVIVHCQTHHRSGLAYLVAKYLGFPEVKAYAASWSEWGNHPDTPVQTL